MPKRDNSAKGKQPKILVLEDDPKLGKTLLDILKAKGYTPLAVLTGKEGVAAIKKEDISLALIDLKPPDISGIEVLKEIKKNSPRTEAIILTAYASLNTAMEAVNLGAFSYLQKPYDMEHLLLDIHRALERKRVEEELQESEEKYRNLFENAGDPLFTLDLDGKFTLVNRATEKLAGCDRKEIMGKHFAEFVPSKYHPILLEAFEKEIRGIPVPTIEIEAKAKNGDLIPIEILRGSIPIKEKGQLIGIQITARDITERKRAEEEIKQYQFMVESAHDAIFFKDLKSRYIIANNKTLEIFGLSREEVIGKNDYEIMPNKEEVKKNVEDDRLVFKTGKSTEITKHMIGADGKEYWFHAVKVPHFDTEGKVIGLIGIARDITKRKRAEEVLQKITHELGVLLSTVPAMFFWIDEEGNFIRVNEAFAAVLHKSPDEVKGKSLFDLYPEDMARKYHNDNLEVMKSGTAKRYIEEPVETPAGIMWVSTDKTPYRDENGNIIGVIGFSVDITERKRAEEEIKAKSMFLERLIQQSPMPTFVLDSKGFTVMVNEAFLKFYAVPKKEMVLGRNALTEPANIRYGVVKYIKEALSGKIVETPEIEFVSPYENKRTITKSRLFPVFDASNKLTNVVVMHEDVTERKKAEEALEHKILALTQPVGDLGGLKLTDIIDIEILQELQDDFARYHGVASIILDHNGEPITEAGNLSEFCSILRSTPKGLEKCMKSDARLGKMTKNGSPTITPCPNFKEILDGAIPIYIKGQYLGSWCIGQMLTEKIDVEKVRWYAREIGADEEKLVETSQKLEVGSKDEFRKIVAFLRTIAKNISLLGLQNLQQARYITERKRLVKELEESHKFLETVIENIPDAIYIKDRQYRLSLLNQACCNRIKVTKDEILGKTRYRKTDEEIFKNGKLIEIPEQFYTDKEEKPHYAHLKKVPLIDKSGKITHVLTISRDITEHKRMDDERERLFKELKELDKMKTNFLSVAYHEMRSPLGPILGVASLLEQEDLTDKQKRLVYIIEKSAEQLGRLINQLLEVTRIDRGKVELTLEKVLIPEIAKNVLECLKPLADAKKQTITIDVPERIEIEGDERKITAIFDNLASNAIKYTEENGEIDIKVADRGEDIVVSIADTGIGISEEHLPRVFERFYMVDTSLTRKGGLGLGLSIVKEYVKLHGGKVWATSELGKGSNFFFTVPKKQKKQKET